MESKNLITKEDVKDIVTSIDEEIKADYMKKFKETLMKKRKQIRMLEITLDKAKKEYEDLISGSKIIGEEEYLFE